MITFKFSLQSHEISSSQGSVLFSQFLQLGEKEILDQSQNWLMFVRQSHSGEWLARTINTLFKWLQ